MRCRDPSGLWRVKANLAWEQTQPRIPEPEEFTRTVLPMIQEVRVGQLVKASRVSWAYCSKIKKGLYVPHPRHWSALCSPVHD